jgi:methylase of polypeptide subunit release factors
MDVSEQDISRLLQESRIGRRVVIATNEHMYTIKDAIEDNWLFYTFFGFRELQKRLLQEGKRPNKVAIIGTGNGVDALGACLFIDGIEELLVTDIDSRVIDLSTRNIDNNIPEDRSKPKVFFFVGDLCNPLSERYLETDLVYGNLPNLPSDSDDLHEGINLSSLYRRGIREIRASGSIGDYLLEMQRLFLDSAKAVLRPGGSVLPIIGGRVPYGLFPRMFAEAGFNFEELCSGFKRQTEAEVIIPEYANAEMGRVRFSFYHYSEARGHLQKLGIGNPTAKINGKELSDILRDYGVSAREALSLYRGGIDIGHTIHFFRGIGVK